MCQNLTIRAVLFRFGSVSFGSVRQKTEPIGSLDRTGWGKTKNIQMNSLCAVKHTVKSRG